MTESHVWYDPAIQQWRGLLKHPQAVLCDGVLYPAEMHSIRQSETVMRESLKVWLKMWDEFAEKHLQDRVR